MKGSTCYTVLYVSSISLASVISSASEISSVSEISFVLLVSSVSSLCGWIEWREETSYIWRTVSLGCRILTQWLDSVMRQLMYSHCTTSFNEGWMSWKHCCFCENLILMWNWDLYYIPYFVFNINQYSSDALVYMVISSLDSYYKYFGPHFPGISDNVDNVFLIWFEVFSPEYWFVTFKLIKVSNY